jgi:hypothetical protein
VVINSIESLCGKGDSQNPNFCGHLSFGVGPAFCNVRPRNARNSRFLDRMAGFYRNHIRLRATRLRRDEEVAGKG